MLFVGSEGGAFASLDSGTTWVNVNSPGLANTVVDTLVFQGPRRLFAFTHGRGAFVASVGNVGPTPALKIVSLAASPTVASVGRTIIVSITIRNDGTGPARLTTGQVVVDGGTTGEHWGLHDLQTGEQLDAYESRGHP